MARISRVVTFGYTHHVTQRGVREIGTARPAGSEELVELIEKLTLRDLTGRKSGHPFKRAS